MAVAKKPKQPLTPQSFYALPVAKKPHVLALTYMNRCCVEGFSKKSLFALRHYFATRVSHSDYQVLYDYLHSLSEVTPCTLYELFDKARAWQGQLRLGQEKSVEVDDYPSLLQCLNEL